MVSKLELRDIVDFHPVLLCKQDLFELEKLILDSFTHENDSINFTLIYKEKSFKASTISDLIQFEELPKSTTKLSIIHTGWIDEDDEAYINRGINLEFYRDYIHCQIYSYDDDWSKGELSRLRSFFKKRKPWYAFLYKILIICPSFPLASLIRKIFPHVRVVM